VLAARVLQPSKACSFFRAIPEIDICQAAQLMLKRYGDKALELSDVRADELAAQAITTVPRYGAGSPMPSASSRTEPRPARCTDAERRG
jgi:hypothetical protein